MRNFVRLVLWTLLFVLLPLAAFGRRKAAAAAARAGATRSARASRSASRASAAASARASPPATPLRASRAIPALPARCSRTSSSGMVLIESIAIYGLVIAFLLQGKISESPRVCKAPSAAQLERRLSAGRELDAGLTPFVFPRRYPCSRPAPRNPPTPGPVRGAWRACPRARVVARASDVPALATRRAARMRVRT